MNIDLPYFQLIQKLSNHTTHATKLKQKEQKQRLQIRVFIILINWKSHRNDWNSNDSTTNYVERVKLESGQSIDRHRVRLFPTQSNLSLPFIVFFSMVRNSWDFFPPLCPPNKKSCPRTNWKLILKVWKWDEKNCSSFQTWREVCSVSHLLHH